MSVISRKTLWEGNYLRSVLLEYIDGRDESPASVARVRTWETIQRLRCDGVVVIVPFTDNAEVVLIRQYRPPVDSHVVELPAGLVDPGETAEASARRELIEETGYEAGKMELMISGPASAGSSSEILDVFVASGLRFIGIGKRDEAENIEVIHVPLGRLNEEIIRLMNEGSMIDLKVHGMIRLAEEFLRSRSA